MQKLQLTYDSIENPSKKDEIYKEILKIQHIVKTLEGKLT